MLVRTTSLLNNIKDINAHCSPPVIILEIVYFLWMVIPGIKSMVIVLRFDTFSKICSLYKQFLLMFFFALLSNAMSIAEKMNRLYTVIYTIL